MAKTRIHRIDENEPEIIGHLEAVGVLVEKIGQPVDLLTSYEHKIADGLKTSSCVLIEVKESLASPINRKQMNFIGQTAFDVGIAVLPTDAEALAKRGTGLFTNQEKWEVVKFLEHSNAKRISTKDFLEKVCKRKL